MSHENDLAPLGTNLIMDLLVWQGGCGYIISINYNKQGWHQHPISLIVVNLARCRAAKLKSSMWNIKSYTCIWQNIMAVLGLSSRLRWDDLSEIESGLSLQIDSLVTQDMCSEHSSNIRPCFLAIEPNAVNESQLPGRRKVSSIRPIGDKMLFWRQGQAVFFHYSEVPFQHRVDSLFCILFRLIKSVKSKLHITGVL